MLNMVAGIIIDEFGALKENLTERLEDMRQTCFICGIDRDMLERSKNGFSFHYKKEHNMWDYIYYKAYLIKKPETEYTGTESFVHEKIEEMDLDWFPIRKYDFFFGNFYDFWREIFNLGGQILTF